MKYLVIIVVVLLSGCAFSPPPPAVCQDDGRGMYPINPQMLTAEQLQEGKNSAKPKGMENNYVSP